MNHTHYRTKTGSLVGLYLDDNPPTAGLYGVQHRGTLIRAKDLPEGGYRDNLLGDLLPHVKSDDKGNRYVDPEWLERQCAGGLTVRRAIGQVLGSGRESKGITWYVASFWLEEPFEVNLGPLEVTMSDADTPMLRKGSLDRILGLGHKTSWTTAWGHAGDIAFLMACYGGIIHAAAEVDNRSLTGIGRGVARSSPTDDPAKIDELLARALVRARETADEEDPAVVYAVTREGGPFLTYLADRTELANFALPGGRAHRWGWGWREAGPGLWGPRPEMMPAEVATELELGMDALEAEVTVGEWRAFRPAADQIKTENEKP